MDSVQRAARIKESRIKQPISELKRKAEKARERANIWTVEELDYADARARELLAKIKWD